jgi:GNAT superfamily N-acetyltransferase
MSNTAHSIILLRTDVYHADFQVLVKALDAEFWVRYPDTQQNFEPYNKVDDTARVVLALVNGTAAGCGCFRPMTLHTGVAEIKRMYVAPTHRNRGIAGQVLAELERWAREEGFAWLRLETGIRQPEAIAVYQKAGYVLIPNFPPYVGVQESICMEKKLAPYHRGV